MALDLSESLRTGVLETNPKAKPKANKDFLTRLPNVEKVILPPDIPSQPNLSF